MNKKRSHLPKFLVIAIAFCCLTFLPISQSLLVSIPLRLTPICEAVSLCEAVPFRVRTRGLTAPSLPVSQSPSLPNPQIHPLPPSLAQWQTVEDVGDYFLQIKTTAVGYLVWSQFPLKIYLEQPNSLENSASSLRFQQWVTAIKEAIQEWNNYLPLVEIDNSQLADIIIMRSQVEREIQLDRETGLYKIPRAITAQTTYEFYLSSDTPPMLRHRMKVQISPNLGKNATLATARHELGHALGIWGHSDRQTDALYFSQVSDPPPISPRDLNTLKKIYQQPTSLGWQIKN